MTKKNVKLLKGKYPKILKNIKHMDIGDGWFWLIDMLCLSIKQQLQGLKQGVFKMIQIKQKFGGLRFYYEPYEEHITAMVRLAEHMSYTICESCGTTKNVKQTVGGYIAPYCPECMEKEGREGEFDV